MNSKYIVKIFLIYSEGDTCIYNIFIINERLCTKHRKDFYNDVKSIGTSSRKLVYLYIICLLN